MIGEDAVIRGQEGVNAVSKFVGHGGDCICSALEV